MLGLGNNLIHQRVEKVNPIQPIIDSFKARVSSDGGTFEAESCLNTTLTELNNEGLLEQASLVITPNSVEAGKLFSIKPTDGSGDLSVVRATTKTRVNSLGVIESVPINVAALDYSNGSCPSILVEPQRTNLVLRSEEFNDAYWIPTYITIIANDAISPAGNTTADRGTVSSGGNGIIAKSISTTNSTFSVFAKKGNSNSISLLVLGSSHRADFNLDLGTITFSSGTGVSPKIENYGNGWFRCILQNIPSVTQVRIYVGGLGVAVENDYNYVWGAQLEAGTNATSYIPTVASAVTRNADVISKTGISDLIGQTEGSLFIESQLPAVSESSIKTLFALSLDDSNRMTCYASSSSLTYVDTKAGINQEVYNFNFASILGQTLRFAIKWSPNQTKIFINGSLVRTYNLNPAVGFNSLRIGISAFSTNSWNGLIRQNILFPLLTDAELIQLTTL
jgi:hypothetical protein